MIQDQTAFTKAVKKAIPLAEAGKLVTFGIVPHEPNTGYGYIKRGISQGAGFAVDEFVEKPSLGVAKEYLESGDYFWNSGMFLLKAGRYLDELKKHRPDIHEACRLSMDELAQDNDFLRVNKSAFEACPSDSIDYSVMEKTDDAVVVPMDAGWSDIGSWSSLWDISEKDGSGNATCGDVMLHKTSNSYIRTDGKLVAAIGVDDLMIVSTKDVLVVAHRDSVQDVKVIVQQLKARSRVE